MNFYNERCRVIYEEIPKKPLITLEQYTKITPAIKGVRGQLIVDAHNKVLPLYKMDSINIIEEFIPNLLVECMEFSRFEENLNYSYSGLRNTFGAHRITDAQCAAYCRIDGKRAANKQAIGNIIYGGKFGKEQLGNILPNDGWNFRGSGPIQGTGRAIMESFALYLQKEFKIVYTALQVAEKLRDLSEIELGMHFSCWFFAVVKKLIPYALSDNFREIIKRINGGYNGEADRTRYYTRCKSVLR